MGQIVENFDQFIRQASISQVGDPNIFGLNPKKKPNLRKKSRTKPKSKQLPA